MLAEMKHWKSQQNTYGSGASSSRHAGHAPGDDGWQKCRCQRRSGVVWSRLRVCRLCGFAPAPSRTRAPRAEGGNTAADRRKQTRQRPQTRTCCTAVALVVAMGMVSMPPAPGPPACAMVVVRRWAAADDDRQQHVNMRSTVSSGSARPTIDHYPTPCIANLRRVMSVMELARVLLCVLLE